MKVDLQGWSKTVMPNPDHHAEFSLNGTPVGSCAFNDQDAVTAVLAIPDGVAVPGTNVLTVRGTLPPGFSYSYFVLDGITAEFNRPLVPGEGTTHLQAEGAAQRANLNRIAQRCACPVRLYVVHITRGQACIPQRGSDHSLL